MIRRLFTDIAGVYDRMNRLLSLGSDLRWRRQAAALVHGTPSTILDLACGTGDFAFALARRFPGAQILGVDLTPAMLDLARAKNTSPNITFRLGDAQNLSSLAPSFKHSNIQTFKHSNIQTFKHSNIQTFKPSLITCAFGFRNFPDKAAALAEAKRVLAPDGELLVLEFFRPQNRLLGGLTRLWLRAMSFLFARRNAAAYTYLRESIDKTLSAEGFIALAERQGFVLETRHLFFPACSCLLFRSAYGFLSDSSTSGQADGLGNSAEPKASPSPARKPGRSISGSM